MLVLQIQAVILVVIWFAFAALNNGANGFLWGIVGGALFGITHFALVYVLDGLFEQALSGSVASNGISFLSRMTSIIIGFVVCFVALKAWDSRGIASSRAA